MNAATRNLGAWEVILEDGDRTRGIAALDELVESLAGLPAEGTDPADLGRGLAGRAIALMYLAQSERYRQVKAAALACLDGAIEGLARRVHGPSLYSGLAGIAWAIRHLLNRFPGQLEDGGGGETLDAFLLEYLARKPWKRDYDLISGLVGIGLYAWDGLPGEAAEGILVQVLDHLDDLARPMREGVSWHTSPDLLPEWQRSRDPEGYFNLGAAHGVPGVINLLARASSAGTREARARHLALEGFRWLASTRFPDGSGCCFGSVVGSDGTPDAARGSRLAWCYGDLGLSVTLLGAARHLRAPVMEASALEVALRAAGRSMADCPANDAGLCHGAAGNGHLFNRLYQATGRQPFLEASRAWFRKALDLRIPGTGIGGYRAWMKPDHPQGPWLDEPGLLEGSAGIALALFSACHSVRPEWDRMLLADIPAAAAS